MKVNYILAFLFLTFVSIAVIANVNETDLIGCTELNGMGVFVILLKETLW